MGPKGPLCLFSLMHISIIVTSSKQGNAAAASLLVSLSLSSAPLAGCENSSPREYSYPMSPWGRRPEDTLWGCIEGCCGGKEGCTSQYEHYRYMWRRWRFGILAKTKRKAAAAGKFSGTTNRSVIGVGLTQTTANHQTICKYVETVRHNSFLLNRIQHAVAVLTCSRVFTPLSRCSPNQCFQWAGTHWFAVRSEAEN